MKNIQTRGPNFPPFLFEVPPLTDMTPTTGRVMKDPHTPHCRGWWRETEGNTGMSPEVVVSGPTSSFVTTTLSVGERCPTPSEPGYQTCDKMKGESYHLIPGTSRDPIVSTCRIEPETLGKEGKPFTVTDDTGPTESLQGSTEGHGVKPPRTLSNSGLQVYVKLYWK